MKVGFTGTRDGPTLSQTAALENVLAELCSAAGELHHGDCVGADAVAHQIAKKHSYRIVIHPPEVSMLRANCAGDEWMPALPYLERNHAIVDSTDILLACPRSVMGEELRSGTWATVRYNRHQGKPLVLIYPDGSVVRERC